MFPTLPRFVFALALLPQLAFAGPVEEPEVQSSPPPACPWAGDSMTIASATLGQVRVNGQSYTVRGPAKRRAFIEVLLACDAADAVAPFEKWRAKRRGTNMGIAGGSVLAVTPVPWVVLPAMVVGTAGAFTAGGLEGAGARRARTRMLDAISADGRMAAAE